MKLGSHHDPEVRQRMSAARKKAWADPEVRQRMSAARKKALADPEVRQRRQNRSDADGNIVCEACREGNCLCCDGGPCRCVCTLEMDVKRVPIARSPLSGAVAVAGRA